MSCTLKTKLIVPAGTLVHVIAGEVCFSTCVYFTGMSEPSAQAGMFIRNGGAAGAAGAAPAWGAAPCAPAVCVAIAMVNTDITVKTESNRRNRMYQTLP